ncbi:MAG TPA: hypothetical protein VGH37_05005 [Candidatus Acidoferrum sp.]|jgi:hypothetical protein
MRHAIATTMLLALVSSAPAFPKTDTKFESAEVGKSHMEFDCPARRHLRLYVRSGEIHVVGTDDSKISVDLSGKNAGNIQNVIARLTCTPNAAELNVSGGPKSEFSITIHVPKTLDLYARIPAGEVTVENITGNKDVELHAGELIIYVGNANDYGHVDASVITGEVDAEVFGFNKGGLFRTVSRDSNGHYSLHAHVGTGQLTLR